jgi:hypothetical protein
MAIRAIVIQISDFKEARMEERFGIYAAEGK